MVVTPGNGNPQPGRPPTRRPRKRKHCEQHPLAKFQSLQYCMMTYPIPSSTPPLCQRIHKRRCSTLPTDPQAEMLGQKLGQTPTYLTHDGKSWVIHVKRWLPTPSRDAFLAEWNLHPQSRHEIQVYGKSCLEKRWSQSWGFSYKYSGNVNAARPIEESTVIRSLLDTINGLLLIDEEDNAKNNTPQEERPYNGCLQNWYTPNDHIGLHADDERSLNAAFPIWSLSWGGTRRFLLRPKKSKKKTAVNNNNHIIISDEPIELLLEDGDMVLMGGTCQETHKHEVPKFRKTMDPPTSDRINWTIRAFQPSS
ncbi:alkB, alkylation repair homolog 2 (E. coli) [Seminavis robusta]|uniref:AlkB, alkylation repair homolog 2 (E. coli) n=1 Tax=Seminavis robusta TaxID=568900 RepID=A0A9N8HDZ8_9STRA|nr:alkB, alkylation repair homolog 2 (E. coli) [Seminavis robusta]|eukprot:Sro487_g152920.1 alkB, alkylation repair homolog 2 (E. coli) (308) ;mRNA; r:39815-40738